MFRYCIQIKILTSSVRIRNSVCTCLDGFKAGSKLVRFPAWVLCFGRHVFSSGSFGCSRVETWDGCVTSPGKLSSAIVEFVAPLRLWHSLRPPPMVGFVVRVQRAGFQVSLARVWARSYEFGSTRELQEGREERARGRASSFQLSGLDAAHRRLIESDCPYGVEPHPCPWFSGAMPTRHLIFNSMWKITYRYFMSVVTYIRMPKLNGHPHIFDLRH